MMSSSTVWYAGAPTWLGDDGRSDTHVSTTRPDASQVEIVAEGSDQLIANCLA